MGREARLTAAGAGALPYAFFHPNFYFELNPPRRRRKNNVKKSIFWVATDWGIASSGNYEALSYF